VNFRILYKFIQALLVEIELADRIAELEDQLNAWGEGAPRNSATDLSTEKILEELKETRKKAAEAAIKKSNRQKGDSNELADECNEVEHKFYGPDKRK